MLMQFTHRHTSESFRALSTQQVEAYQKSYDDDTKTYIDIAYNAYMMPADVINDDGSISRGTNQESHPSHNPSIANSRELPQKENSFERQEMKKEIFNKQFDLKILTLSNCLLQINLKLIPNGYFVEQGIFGDTVFDLLEVELVL